MKGLQNILAASAALAGIALTAPAMAEDGPTMDQLLGDAASTGDVLTYGMGPQQQRFSPLDQVNTETVAKLVPRLCRIARRGKAARAGIAADRL